MPITSGCILTYRARVEDDRRRTEREAQPRQDEAIAGGPAPDQPDERIARRAPEVLVVGAPVQSEDAVPVNGAVRQIQRARIECGDQIAEPRGQRARG